MPWRPVALLPLALWFLVACDRQPADQPAPSKPTAATAPTTPTQARRDAWPLPAITRPAAQPDLVRAPDGSLLLSWVEHGDTARGDVAHTLKFARFANGAWSEPREIARGGDWFVNWADTPHIAATPDGALWAHWLRKGAQAKYAYDVVLVRSGDGGATWSEPVAVNTDATRTEHGFVSLWPVGENRIGLAWLDGRNTGGGEHSAHGGHASADAKHAPGAMTLRTAVFDASLARSDERELDAMTCDCCQTDAALTARGPLLVYRGRTPMEVRDILAARHDGAQWQGATHVHADNWTMPACPVNGPAVAANGSNAAVAWYTAAGDTPTVKFARSTDEGASFAAPVVLERGATVQGRVDTALDERAAWALWMVEDANGQSLRFARYAPDLSQELQRGDVAQLQGKGRGTGMPKLALVDGTAFVVWTDVVDGKPSLHGARYTAAP
ncbi:sialidase family protein [Lysobacter auxotrophicus]|uniref:Glycoside hydrolase n=1 Tax=Lysobacter auxotrophicus TaxID=2992573 RepID=A0ABN6UF26_9GAMM|nr:sialidase family protein [Lysobacter auxotrophicus]BDU14935.1 glycoside hydrolase [Lysobacter auxotrophicus]